MRTLPPLKALESFEATARLGTVRKAAADLCVTPSAVSHQIAKLEAQLGKALFHRRQQRLYLSDAGRNFLQQVEPAFDRIEEATLDLIDSREVEQLSIAMPPTFMAMWLIPKLEVFRRKFPQIDLRLIDRLTLDEYEDRVDCGIEYRLNASRHLYSEKLFEDQIVPLASPGLCRRENIGGIDDLQNQTLIMTELRLTSWRVLLANKPWLKNCPVLSMRYSYHAFNAAVHGLGVALGNRHNAEHFIRNGLLIIPFEIDRGQLPSLPQYYFSCREQNRSIPKVQAFQAWLRESINASNS
jgi:LysR family glycine cleavage system transcriptional activator